MLGQINSDIISLNQLSDKYRWIPNSETIRPNSNDLDKKRKMINDINTLWESPRDYILAKIFDQKARININNKRQIININSDINEWVFKPSDFRYNLIPESNHYILWNLSKTIYDDYKEEYINQIIIEQIDKITSKPYNFAWYKNPKPTIYDFYHIQVFWIVL
jgi:hypothetical protein